MKHAVLVALGLLVWVLASAAQAVEIMRWERLPLTVPLIVDQERIVFIDRNVRVGVPASVGDRLRVQSAGGAVYLRASEPIEPTRLQLQDTDTGALILLDIAAQSAVEGVPEMEPVQIVEENAAARVQTDDPVNHPAPSPRETPIPVVLTRHAAQQLYAPLRTVEAVSGITRVNLRGDLNLNTLLPTLTVQAVALASWRLEDLWLTAVRLTNTSSVWLELDPRVLQGNFVTATFQHPTLGPRGVPEDTTVVYLVTRGHGLAQSLLPAIQRFDPAVHLLQRLPEGIEGDGHAQ
uniref:TIGR03749 family integrating conjugative element protein n=1 Tax=Halopseudomonas litoralis TaxID=797277 RepID=UPI000B7E4F58|nr:TIGR03749 family integrating conjugative element protein [Halopseudomonas litoralis]